MCIQIRKYLYMLKIRIGSVPTNAMLFEDDLGIREEIRDKASCINTPMEICIRETWTHVSRHNTEYMPPSNTNYTVKVSEEEIPSTNKFNFLGSIFPAEEGQKEIARTYFDCHGINREKRRVLFVTRKCR